MKFLLFYKNFSRKNILLYSILWALIFIIILQIVIFNIYPGMAKDVVFLSIDNLVYCIKIYLIMLAYYLAFFYLLFVMYRVLKNG
jgi:hypothetical protein